MSVPLATYRLQLLPHAYEPQALAEALDYLVELGIRDVYLSPCFRARADSTHGYDVVSFSEPLGAWGVGGDERLRSALEARGLRAVVDMVPNHMATSPHENAWWRDVLLRGEGSGFAGYFDIDWAADVDRKLVLPVLPEPLEALVARGAVRMERGAGGWLLVTPWVNLPLGWDQTEPPSSLMSMLAAQHYRLVSVDEVTRVSYRRYLDINELAALRVEDEAVFESTHATLLEWIEQGWVSGVRVDHPDGLAEPAAYFARIRRRASSTWLLAEKPLRPGAPLPAGWCVDGTTGYDFLALTLGLFLDEQGLRELPGVWRDFTAETARPFDELAAEGKRHALRVLLSADLARTARAACSCLGLLPERLPEVSACVEALILGLPAGRTFLEAGIAPSAEDRRALELAARRATEQCPDAEALPERLVHAMLHSPERSRELRARFQQLAAAAGAKGEEDTAFYRYQPLIALCELGCDPREPHFSVEAFHAHASLVSAQRPFTMSTTSTHDTKRGEDARLRIAALSEMPGALAEALARFRLHLPDPRAVGASMQVHLIQTLIGAWPVSEERLSQYATKAAREAKLHTSWLAPSSEYEAALIDHVRGMLRSEAFIAELEWFLRPVLALARTYSLAQLLLKLTAPGVPDIYQGSELWEEHLVDPDNRRPVDFAACRALLRAARGWSCEDALAAPHGATKLWLLDRALRVRREHREVFAGEAAGYTALAVTGQHHEQVLAFARGGRVVTVVPRLLGRAPEGLVSTRVELPGDGAWQDVLSGRTFDGSSQDAGDLLAKFPVALLVHQ